MMRFRDALSSLNEERSSVSRRWFWSDIWANPFATSVIAGASTSAGSWTKAAIGTPPLRISVVARSREASGSATACPMSSTHSAGSPDVR